MKKAILSALCSALVIPGLGQIINGHLKKAVCILFTVFVLMLVGVFGLYRTITSMLDKAQGGPANAAEIMERLNAENFSFFWYLIAAFGALWLYSVLDGYISGRRIDRRGNGDIL